jgi:hypothetical protein
MRLPRRAPGVPPGHGGLEQPDGEAATPPVRRQLPRGSPADVAKFLHGTHDLDPGGRRHGLRVVEHGGRRPQGDAVGQWTQFVEFVQGRGQERRAAAEAALAIAMWEHEPPESRPLDDEALAHIYEATAWVHLGELDEAARSVAPILDLPEDRKISWIAKRLHKLADELDAQVYTGSSNARDLKTRILTATS